MEKDPENNFEESFYDYIEMTKKHEKEVDRLIVACVVSIVMSLAAIVIMCVCV